jgi:receptor expression-enhancing protein 5/6
LDFAHVVGDVIFGLAALPFIYVIQWWQRRFGTERESLDTETEASSNTSSPIPNGNGQPSLDHANASQKPVKSKSHCPPKSLQPTTKASTSNLTNQKASSQVWPSAQLNIYR